MKKRHIFLSIIAFAALIFSSCSDIDGSDEDNKTSPSNNTAPTITLRIADANSARTALPEVNLTNVQTGSETAYGDLPGMSFVLTGRSADYDETVKDPMTYINTVTVDNAGNATYTEGYTWSKYTDFKNSQLQIGAGTWSFTLTVSYKRNSTPVFTYSGKITGKVIGGGNNEIDFTLGLTDLNTTQTTNVISTGALEITVKLGDENNNLLYDATSNPNGISHITGKLFKKGDGYTYTTDSTYGTEANLTQIESSNSFKYTATGLLGTYLAQFTLYAVDGTNEVPVATYREAVYINHLNASSTISIMSLDEVYGITYLKRTNFDTALSAFESGDSNTNRDTYSRRSTFNLTRPSTDSAEFWRWIELKEVSETSENETYLTYNSKNYTIVKTNNGDIQAVGTVNGIADLGNKVYLAEFINAEATPRISRVEIEGTTVVGNTLTAKAYKDETNEFTAPVTWQWYVYSEPSTTAPATNVGADPKWIKITGGTDGNYTDSEDLFVSGTNLTAPESNTLTILPQYVGKYITAIAVQQYIVTTENDQISDVYENLDKFGTASAVTYLTTGVTDTSFTQPVAIYKVSDKVAAGSLALSDGFKLTNTVSTVAGHDLTNSYQITGSLSDSVSADWLLALPSNTPISDTTVVRVKEINVFESSTDSTGIGSIAPSATGEYTATVKIAVEKTVGEVTTTYYETTFNDVPVIVSVQKEAPDAAWFTFRAKDLVTKDHIRFNTNENINNLTLQYTFSDPNAEDFQESSWQNWKTTNVTEGKQKATDLEIDVSSVSDTNVYVRTAAEGTTENLASYTAPSAPTSAISFAEAIGTLVRLTGVHFEYPDNNAYTGDNAAPEFGNAVTAVLEPAGTNNGTYAYQWYKAVIDESENVGTYTAIEGATSATLNLDNAEYVGKSLKVEVVVTYNTVSTQTKDGNAVEDTVTECTQSFAKKVLPGKLDLSAVYSGSENSITNYFYYGAQDASTKLLPGATPVVSLINIASDKSIKNKLGTVLSTAGDTWHQVTYTFKEEIVQDSDTGAGTPTVTNFTTWGYVDAVTDKTLTNWATTKFEISAPGYDTETVYVAIPVDNDLAKYLLRNDVQNIPYGHVQFKSDVVSGLKYSLTEIAAAADGWLSADTTPFNLGGSYGVANSSNSTVFDSVQTANFYDADDSSKRTVWVKYAGSDQILAVDLSSSENNSYIGTRNVAVTVTISETSGKLSVYGSTVVAPATWHDFKWYVNQTGLNYEQVMVNGTDSTQTAYSEQSLSVATGVTGTYNVRLEALDEFGDEQWAEATVSVRYSN